MEAVVVHASKSLSYIQNNERDLQCLVCNKVGYSNTTFYACESEHFRCKTCSITEAIEQGKQDPKADSYISNINIRNKTDNNYGQTTIDYKNNNFRGSMSTIDSSLMNITSEHEESSLARPVICPVTICGKMLATDSILQHFYFDHSKITKIILKPRKSHRITQNSYVFKNHTQCIGIFDHQFKVFSSKYLQETPYSNDDLHAKASQHEVLLLCALTVFNTTKTADTTKISVKKNHKETSQSKFKKFDNNDILLIWLCKTANNTHSYKITLSREDKLLSYSFTGEPVHIRDSQDANSIYNRSDCLIVRGVAANRLLDKHNQFHIFVSIV